MYMIDPPQSQRDVDNIRSAMKSAKGPGNFRNLFMYSPNGKKDGIQTISLSEVAAKDEFLNINNVGRNDMMAEHRVPPQLMGSSEITLADSVTWKKPAACSCVTNSYHSKSVLKN